MPIDPKKIEEWKRLSAETRGVRVSSGPVRESVEYTMPTNSARVDQAGGMPRIATWMDDAVPALLSERKEMLDLLRELEWVEHVNDDRFDYLCPLCGRSKYDAIVIHQSPNQAHAADCRLAAFLR